MRRVKIVLIVFLLSVAGLSIVLGQFVDDVITDIKSKEQRLVNFEPRGKTLLFEEGSHLNKEDIRFIYGLVRSAPNYQQWLQANSETLITQENNLLLMKDLSLDIAGPERCDSNSFCLKLYQKLENIPSLIWRGLIGIEDNRFLEHSGLDFFSIMRAIFYDIKEMSFKQGGSTLTQQMAKNLFYSNKKTISRKIKEMVAALYLEKKLQKERIIELYLNEVYWGSHHGIQIRGYFMASMYYFNKRPQDLNSFEVSILIGLLKGPSFYNPLRHLDRLKVRTKAVMDRLVKVSLLEKDNIKIWSGPDWENWVKSLKSRLRDGRFMALAQSIFEPVDDDLFYEKFLLTLHSNEVVSDLKSKFKGMDFASKVLIKKLNLNKEIRIYTKFERAKNIAIEKEKHQVGSILKPMIYSFYTKKGLLFTDYVSMDTIELNIKSGKWSPKEGYRNFPKEVEIKEALFKSYNRPVVRLAEKFGWKELEDYLIGIQIPLQTPLKEYPAQLLGSVEMSLNEIQNSYESFVKADCANGFEKSILHLMSDPKNTTIKNHVGPILGELAFFGKTGTTNNGMDNWFVFFDGATLGIVWTGVEKRDVINKNFRSSGASTSFGIFKKSYEARGKRFQELRCLN